MHKGRGRSCGLSIHKRSCYRKVRHATEYLALEAMHALEKRTEYDGKPLKVYECSACGGGWHVAHATPPRKKKGTSHV